LLQLFSGWCWRTCQPSCGYIPITPNNIIVNGDSCRYSGKAYGPTAGASACQTAKSRCSTLLTSGQTANSFGAIGPVTLSQCSNIAMGACQSAANLDSCGGAAEFGFGSCSAATFRQYFAQAAASACRSYATTVTDVAPGTNQWAPVQPIQPYYVGSSAPGGGAGGVGSAAPPAGISATTASAPGDDGSSDGGDDSSSSDGSGGKRRLLGAGRRMLRAV
jgi:hypothetical protein